MIPTDRPAGLNSDLELHRSRGVQHYHAGELQAAIQDFETCLKLDPSQAEDHYLLGMACYHAGRTAGAIASLSRAVELDPQNRIAHYQLAMALARAGNLKQCIHHLEEIISSGCQDAAAYYHLGVAYYNLGDLPQAARHFAESLRMDPLDERSRRFFRLIAGTIARPARKRRGWLGRVLNRVTAPLARSLLLRLGLPGAIGFLVLAAAFGLYSVIKDNRTSLQEAQRELQLMSETIEHNLLRSMRLGHQEDLQSVVEAMMANQSVVSIRLYSKPGKVMASSATLEVGKILSRESEPCRSCHGLEKGPQTGKWGEFRVLSLADGSRSLGLLRPIYNESSCAGCHLSTTSALAMLDVALSLRPADVRAGRRRTEILVFAAISVVLISILTLAVLHFWVRRPISALDSAVRRVASGDLDVEIPVEGSDELANLLRSFNVMTSEIRQARHEAEQFGLELHRRIAEATEQLRAKNQELSQVNQKLVEFDLRKSAFVQKMVHELRSPLAAVMSLQKAVAEQNLGKLNPAQRDFLDRAQRRGENLVAVINDLLDLERLRSETAPVPRQSINIGSISLKVVELFRARADEKGLRFSEEVSEGLPLVPGNPEEIEEVVINLLDNAIKYTPEGGEVSLTAFSKAGRIVLEVKDTGIGIPADEQAELFSEFFRASNARQLARDGTGLGLAIVKKIVESYGGSIQVESQKDRGTAVRFSLPIHSAADGASS